MEVASGALPAACDVTAPSHAPAMTSKQPKATPSEPTEPATLSEPTPNHRGIPYEVPITAPPGTRAPETPAGDEAAGAAADAPHRPDPDEVDRLVDTLTGVLDRGRVQEVLLTLHFDARDVTWRMTANAAGDLIRSLDDRHDGHALITDDPIVRAPVLHSTVGICARSRVLAFDVHVIDRIPVQL